MISIFITIVSTPHVSPVKNKRHVFICIFTIDFFQFRQHGAIQKTCPNYKNSVVGILSNDLRIRHDVDRGTINENIIVPSTHLRQQLSKTGVEK